jgi:hypothetical protein
MATFVVLEHPMAISLEYHRKIGSLKVLTMKLACRRNAEL